MLHFEKFKPRLDLGHFSKRLKAVLAHTLHSLSSFLFFLGLFFPLPHGVQVALPCLYAVTGKVEVGLVSFVRKFVLPPKVPRPLSGHYVAASRRSLHPARGVVSFDALFTAFVPLRTKLVREDVEEAAVDRVLKKARVAAKSFA